MSSDGRETTFTYYGPGSWFGQIALLDGLSRTDDIRACGETVLVNILHRDFNELLESNPIFCTNISPASMPSGAGFFFNP